MFDFLEMKRKINGHIIKHALLLTIFILVVIVIFIFSGCRNYDGEIDIAYFFKTEPERTVIDLIQSLNNNDPQYIYSNLILNRDKNNISKEKFEEEFLNILSDVENIEIERTVYLGYEHNMSKVVAEFSVEYKNGEVISYKKYIYLIEENNRWKIVFEKTFI